MEGREPCRDAEIGSVKRPNNSKKRGAGKLPKKGEPSKSLSEVAKSGGEKKTKWDRPSKIEKQRVQKPKTKEIIIIRKIKSRRWQKKQGEGFKGGDFVGLGGNSKVTIEKGERAPGTGYLLAEK